MGQAPALLVPVPMFQIKEEGVKNESRFLHLLLFEEIN